VSPPPPRAPWYICRSPVKEVVYAVRAISPLLVALVFLVVVVLRQPLPSKGFTDDDDDESNDSSNRGGGNSSSKDVHSGDLDSANRGAALGKGTHGADVEQGTDQVRGGGFGGGGGGGVARGGGGGGGGGWGRGRTLVCQAPSLQGLDST
jgi:hypothetical protein